MIRNSTVEFLIFMTGDGGDGIEVRYEDESIWLTQKLMAELFSVDRSVITKHLKNIFSEGELQEESNVQKMHIAHSDKPVNFYKLDVIISVGYRINSTRATQFRQWATQILREFALKGYVIDKKRLENGTFLGKDYFEHLLAEIREIRLSERRFYQKITDIYATSVDYDKDAPATYAFFAKVQNKLHYAIHGYTASELIYQPNISVCRSIEGEIAYCYYSPEKEYGYIAKEYETFQEALSILEEESKQGGTQIASEDISITQPK